MAYNLDAYSCFNVHVDAYDKSCHIMCPMGFSIGKPTGKTCGRVNSESGRSRRQIVAIVNMFDLTRLHIHTSV